METIPTPVVTKRLLSLDALRGFDMFWIISGEGIFHGLGNVVMEKHHLLRNPTNWQIASNDNLNLTEQMIVGISNQLHHSPWNGFTFYDLIFPLFIFIAGLAMPFAFERYFSITDFENQTNAKKKIYFSLIKRTIALILLGMIVNGLFKWQGYENTRFASVLARIGLATFFAAIIYLNCSFRAQLLWFIMLLLGYWALLTLVPVPNYGAGSLTAEGNLVAYVDQLFLPGKLHRTIYDPEGLLSTLPAIASALLGIFVGKYVKLKKDSSEKLNQLLWLTMAGLVLLFVGWAWGFILPINKNMWTSSFVLFAGGFSILLFTLFYALIDCYQITKWSKPFLWIGSNSILIYIAAHGLINFEHTSQFLFGGIITQTIGAWQQVTLWIGVCIIQLVLLRFLYLKKWFLKL
jgi:predicted acyltransferase